MVVLKRASLLVVDSSSRGKAAEVGLLPCKHGGKTGLPEQYLT